MRETDSGWGMAKGCGRGLRGGGGVWVGCLCLAGCVYWWISVFFSLISGVGGVVVPGWSRLDQSEW